MRLSKKEQLRRKFSALLIDTDEKHPIECYIPIGEDEACGLSSLELPTITEVFQEPSEGIIWFKFYGQILNNNGETSDNLVEFDSLELKDLQTVYKELS